MDRTTAVSDPSSQGCALADQEDLLNGSTAVCTGPPLLIDIQIMILEETFKAVRVDSPRRQWTGERPGDIALRWFCYSESAL